MADRADLIDELERTGFYAFTVPGRVAAAKRRSARGADLYDDTTKRFFFCDSEDLAEGGVLRLLRKIQLRLAARGCRRCVPQRSSRMITTM